MAQVREMRRVTVTQLVALTIPFASGFVARWGHEGHALDWVVLLCLIGVAVAAVSFRRGVRYLAALGLMVNLVGVLWYAFIDSWSSTF
jgi:hypothetical protein